MALAVAEAVAEVLDTTGAETYATGSWTPAANSLLVAYAFANATAVNNGFSGGSLTWNEQFSATTGGNINLMSAAQVGASPSAMTVTFDCTGDASTGCDITVFEITGHNVSAPFPQAAVSTAGIAATTPTVTFASNLDTDNAYLAWLHNGTNPCGATAPSGFSNIATTGFNSPATGVLASFKVNGETGTVLTWGASASAWRTAGIEIAVAPTGGGILVHGGQLIKGRLVRGGRLVGGMARSIIRPSFAQAQHDWRQAA